MQVRETKKGSKKKCDFFFVGSIEAKPETAVTSLTCQNSIYFGRGREREREGGAERAEGL